MIVTTLWKFTVVSKISHYRKCRRSLWSLAIGGVLASERTMRYLVNGFNKLYVGGFKHDTPDGKSDQKYVNFANDWLTMSTDWESYAGLLDYFDKSSKLFRIFGKLEKDQMLLTFRKSQNK